MPPTNSTVSNLDTSPQIPAVHGLLVRSAHPLDDTPEKKRDAAPLGPMLYDQERARLVVCTESIPNFDGVPSRVPILEFALKRMVMPGKYPFVPDPATRSEFGTPAMAATMISVNLVGEIGLLLWGTHMATSGVLRAYGTDVRRWLGRSLHHPMMAILAGMLVTALLQSSTATSLMATSFASSGVIDLASGLSGMLGANIGTTLIVQVLSFNLSVIAPLLILVGVIVFRRGDGDTQIEQLGRILIGLGLMLLALSMLARTTAAVEAAPLAKAVLRSLIGQPVLAVVLAAAFTWACHSSVAVMLLIVSLVTSRVIEPLPALALVLGANVGGTLPAYFEAHSAAARRLPLGNTLVRLFGCIVAAPMLPFVAHVLTLLQPDPARMIVNFHTLFNVTLALLFIGPIDRIANALIRLIPDPPLPEDPGVPRYLEEAALDTASFALANAAREALRMADMIENMS